MRSISTFIFIATTIAGNLASAIELQLREDVRAAGALVLVGDIAEVHGKSGEDTDQIAGIDLLPAPPIGEKRTLRLREIQDLLAVRGANLGMLRFSGASQVIIRGPKRETPVAETPIRRKPTTRPVAKTKVTEAVRTSIVKYLNETQGELGWQAKLELNDDKAAQIDALGTSLVATGGQAPWSGKQRFALGAENGVAEPVEVTVQIELPPALVVAKYSLPRGVLVRADDVRLQPGIGTSGKAEVFTTIEEVVGKETNRVIAEGQILDDQALRRRVLFKRGEIVTVHSRSQGVNVHMTARARDDGSEGDLVMVETIEDRKGFMARVCGPQQAEVFAQATKVPSETANFAKPPLDRTQAPAAPVAPLPTSEQARQTVQASAKGKGR